MLIGFFLLVVTPFDGAADVRNLVEAGDRAYAQFRTRDAIVSYARAYESDPKSFVVLSRLARSWSDLGRLTLRSSDSSEIYYRNGLRYAEELVRSYPDSADSWFLLALCHGSLTPFKSLTEKLAIAQDVEQNARRALAIDPTYSMVHVLLGIYYRGVSGLSWIERTIVNGILGKNIVGTLDDSHRHLADAISLDPGNAFAYYELSRTLRSMGREKEGLEALRKVTAFTPTNEREKQMVEDAGRRLQRAVSDR